MMQCVLSNIQLLVQFFKAVHAFLKVDYFPPTLSTNTLINSLNSFLAMLQTASLPPPLLHLQKRSSDHPLPIILQHTLSQGEARKQASVSKRRRV